jgi:integrase
MARRPRASRLENRSNRLKLPVRWKPYDYTTISPGIAIGYRRNQSAGVWVVRVADGHGGNWTKRVGLADDFEDADGANVLSFWEAQDKARKLPRGSDADAGRPATVAEAIASYEADLAARGGAIENAARILKHITPALASKPVGLLTARELAHWRDQLLAAGMKSATLVRLAKAFKASLNLSARRDPRILNRAAWRDALSGIAENYTSRNVQRLDDAQVQAIVAAAYEIDPSFGLYVEVHAQTGARSSQIARLTVGDLLRNPARLHMPSSRKGKNRKASQHVVAITDSLAQKLASNRPAEAPLLLRADKQAWQSTQDGDHEGPYAKAAAIAGVDGTTIYALRHSSIVRMLLANVPVRLVASAHDTSVAMIERTYSRYISNYADSLMRGTLLDFGAIESPKVVPLRA